MSVTVKCGCCVCHRIHDVTFVNGRWICASCLKKPSIAMLLKQTIDRVFGRIQA